MNLTDDSPVPTVENGLVEELRAALQIARLHNRELSDELEMAERRQRELSEALNAAEWRFHEATTSTTWRLARFFGRMRQSILPSGSWRTRAVKFVLKPLRREKLWYQAGPTSAEWQAFMERIDSSNPPIVFLPSVPWSLTLFQRPQHMARAFARLGHPTLYVCNGTSENVAGIKEIEPNLFLFKGATQSLRELPKPILWSLTYNVDQIKLYAPDAQVVYDWIDDLSVFEFDSRWLRSNHRRALRDAKLIACVARKLHEEAVSVRPDSVYLPNAVEYEHFADDCVESPADPALSELLSTPGPIAGYYGALARWFDYALLYEVARRRPDWRFVLIGPDYDGSMVGKPLFRCPNVHYLGTRAYPTLPGYLKLFDVAMIPFAINDITLATSPLKLYEFLAAGKPVVTTPMPECQAYAEVLIAQHAAEFSLRLDMGLSLGRTESYRQWARSVGAANSWSARARQALAQLHTLQQNQPASRRELVAG